MPAPDPNRPLTGLMALGRTAAGQLGTITYNGISFGASRKSSLVGEFVYDDADLVVTHVKYRLTVHAFLTSSTVAAEATAMEDLQNRLSSPGQQLKISGIGFDDGIDTAREGVSPDLIFGAKPRLLQFVEVTGGMAWEFVWQCEFNVSRCGSAFSDVLKTPPPWLAFNYDVVYSIDDEGLMVRITSGYVQIPIVRDRNRNPLNAAGLPTGNPLPNMLANIDQVWDRLEIAVPVGFARGERTRRLNDAKNRLEFTIVDHELRGAVLPAGIIRGEGDYDFESSGAGFVQWVASLNMSLTVAPGYPPSLAAIKFFTILTDKVVRLGAAAKRRDPRSVVIPTKIRIGHSLWTRTSRFSCQYTVVACLHEILTTSGIWAELPEKSYPAWAKSMARSWGNRGFSGLVWNEATGAVVDLCQNIRSYKLGSDARKSVAASGEESLLLTCPGVTEEASYIAYQNKLHLMEGGNAIVHDFAQSYDPDSPPRGKEFRESVVQYQGAPALEVLVTGYADRVGFKPAAPKLLSYGGMKVHELERNVVIDDTPSASFVDCPLYRGRWSILYRVLGLSDSKSSSKQEWSGSRPAPQACGLDDKKKAKPKG